MTAARPPRGDPYAGIPGRRLFVAAPLPEAPRASVEALIGRVRAVAVPGEREVRWVRVDGLHVTLRFIGPTLEPRVAQAVAALGAAAAVGAPFAAGLDGAGAFPPGGRPRALWLGIGAGATEFAALAGALDRELVARGWPSDPRPFRSHLTLARSDGVASGGATAARLEAEAAGLDAAWTVDRIVLFESVTGGGPARYIPLAEALLTGRA